MKIMLAENIRQFRKERKLTQEKLAEALGVTVGAVYKWESGQSQPELATLMEIADFFDISVDLLLGYHIKDNRLDAAIERVLGYMKTLDPEALLEADKLRAKYPHSFKVIYGCAQIYLVFGSVRKDKALLKEASALLEQARILLPQNQNPRVSDLSICRDLATAWLLSDEHEKGLDLLKSNNIDGISSDMIGTYLAIYLNRPEEAVPYLSEAFLDHFSALLNIAASYAFVFYSRKDWKAALDILQWAIASLKGLTTEDGSGSFLKIHIYLLALLASIQAKLSQEEASQKALAEAVALARQFDSQPDYRIGGIRFIDPLEQSFSYDILGTSAEESVSTLFRFLNDPVFSEKWKEAMSHEF